MFGNISGSIFGSIFGSMFGEKSSYYTSFGSKVGQPLSTVVVSRIVKLKTIPVDSVLTIVGGEYQINGGTWVSIAGTLDPTDTIKVRLSSSASYLTGNTCTATINSVAYTFTVTTAAEVVVDDDPIPPIISNYLFGGFGDSRADLMGGSTGGPDMYDGTKRTFREPLSSESTFLHQLKIIRPDFTATVNGGCSGEPPQDWDSAGRITGRTYGAVTALPFDFIVIQYDTNAVTASVTTTVNRDSVATMCITENQNLITALLADKPSVKVFFQTVTQRSDTIGGACYGATYAALRRDCCDYINYGNGGAITGMVAWIKAHPLYNSRLFVHEHSGLLNLGGAQTGAYLDTTWAPDGCHLGFYGARRDALDFATQFESVLPKRGVLPLYRAAGNNLIATVDASSYKGEMLSQCTKSAITYGVDSNGRGYGEVTITPNNTAVGFFKFELHADTGTNAGRTPAGDTFAVNDLLQYRILFTVDNGAGGAPSANNVLTRLYCSYIGGTPAMQDISNGAFSQGTMPMPTPDIDASYACNPFKMKGDSSLIGAPAAGLGLRIYCQIYFGITPTPFRVRWAAPEIRKIV